MSALRFASPCVVDASAPVKAHLSCCKAPLDPSTSRLRLRELGLDADVNVVAHGRIPRPQTELRAAEAPLGREAELVLFGQRIRCEAIERHGERHGACRAAYRQVSCQCPGGLAGALKAR